MIRVVYDISVLGIGHYSNRARTGIARVVENLASELANRSDIDLRFSGFHSLDTHFRVRQYLNAQEQLNPDLLVKPIGILGEALCKFYDRSGLSAPEALQSRNVLLRATRRAQYTLSVNTGFFPRLCDLIGKTGCDVFHSPFLPFPKTKRTLDGPRRFITVYDLIPLLHPHFFRFKESQQIKAVVNRISPDDFVFSISESTKNDLCNYASIDPERVVVTHLAASEKFQRCADPDRIRSTREKLGIPDSPYVLSLCTLEPRKNIDQTIRSFYELITQENINDLNLVLVGEKGWKFDRIFDELKRSHVAKNRIFVTGYVSDEDLAPLYSGARMFVYPSFYEGFGLPPLEAMQCGVPVITSNTSSLPEVVGDAGIMVAPDDGDAICQAMLNIHRSEDLRSALSRKGMDRASHFSWRKCADETIRGYQLSQ